ncbi:DUF2589 domain-containing protein [Pectobacterium carotovorum]|uniref:DUF2589 domain-containing protein n=1 Tax=Pectobacterium carotovorum TaxID=554 RepID=UPI0029D7982E|nr:DUF2589 domain-containing protein [Pectobacterium carotovorum]MDX6916168.1 DUF2589 domain-containing protein [Pectobacterium carotovorum]
MDSQFIGSVINALPLENMISGPLQAMINAQIQASKAYTDFLLSVCIQNNKAVAIQFDYDEMLIDESGAAKGAVTKTMRIPLIAAITHPIISIEEGTIDFELEVTQSESSSDDTGEDGNLAASLGWGPFKVKMAGRVSHKSAQTRATDTRAKYSIHTQIKRQPAPEALMRVIDFLTDAATRPSIPSRESALQTKENAAPTAPVEQREESS